MRLLWTNLTRLWHLLGVGLRHGLGYLLGERVRRWGWLARRLPPVDLDGPERLRALFEDLGGTFVKFGQMLALQPDIVSLEYCNALFKLLDRVEPFEFDDVERIFYAEHGVGIEEVFDSIERTPLATASVGQVHVAWIHGVKVAVKVQRPNVDYEFGSDIRLMVATMAAIRTLRLGFLEWLLEPTSEFVAWTREELDFRCEARYTEQLRHLAQDNAVQYVPRVWSRYTSRRTLVIEFLEGATLLAYLRAKEEGDEEKVRGLEPPGFDAETFAAHVIDNFLGDAFENGIYHADLHPANLLILPENVVGYIDFGITGVMSRHARRHLVSMTLALAVGDMELLYDQFLEVAAYDPEADPRAFRAGLDVLARQWYSEGGSGRTLKVNFTRIMGDMLTLSRQTHVLPERDIVKYIRSAIAIDGLVTRFAPAFDVGEYLAQACARYLLWQGRKEQVDPERLLDWVATGGKLLRDGPRRVERVLDRLVAGELPVRLEERRAPRAGAELPLALAAVAVALVAWLVPPAEPALGFNLWTAQVGFVAVACVTLISTAVRRMLGRGSH